MNELGLRAVELCPNINGKNVDELELWEFYAEAERLGVSLIFHGDATSKVPGHERMGKYWYPACLGFTFDYAMAITCLVFSGILDAFPNLKICFAEGGISYLPFLADRLEGTADAFEPKQWKWRRTSRLLKFSYESTGRLRTAPSEPFWTTSTTRASKSTGKQRV